MLLKKLLALRPNSLKQKTALFILLPTFLIMASIGGIGQRLVRQVLLEQWQETAITKLQRSAHYVDMRLMRPKEILRFLQNKEQKNLQWNEIKLLLDQLHSLDGVVQVNHEWNDKGLPHATPMSRSGKLRQGDGQRITNISISPPQYNTEFLSETVSLIAVLQDAKGENSGHIEVVLSFYDLIDQIVKSPWWKSNHAFIVDDDRNILTSTSLFIEAEGDVAVQKFGTDKGLENDTWQALQNKNSGTAFSKGSPPEEVSGFYRLTQAPWTLVIIAPGKQVLKPILEFKKYYYLILWIGILGVLAYVLVITGKTTRSINKLSKAAEDLAQGTFKEPLIVDSRDEVGVLTTNFNLMADQLQERLQLQEAMDIAREVQQNLLFHESFVTDGLEIAGVTLYCDETGGDYIDLLFSSHQERRATVVVGDVVGHGIGAALLMATVRALLRGRACCSGGHGEVATDVNKLLCRDTSHSGNFVTMFYLEIDRENRFFNWVRCGHEPALLYCPENDTFQELRGDGLVLGFDQESSYSDNVMTFPELQQVILVGSDGVWDVENKHGERFGQERVKSLMKTYYDLPAEKLIEKITGQIARFRGDYPQNDDITLAIIKTW
ncbi:SpoIIE family protein phosphatase [Desulfopila sp. IMCC35008]|uniref:SpoIIE family protein phosphatase n=1 Tax=Desulfopila sp. IMCC35008 TaxID=2653858 RepID=UPI0013D02157|nr:SpoIIE family protein phosphatase [Desulfopila sp. IMCC35008]